MSYEAIVFDLDGTLINAAASILAAYNYALNPFGIHVNLNDIELMRSYSSEELFLDRLSKDQAKIAVQALHNYSTRAAEHTLLLPGVKTMLANLAELKTTIALWTGRDRASALQILKHHDIHHYFEKIVTCCDVKKNKPNGEGLILLAHSLQIDPTSMIHIGDHEHDLLGAKHANVTSVHARWSHEILNTEHHPLSNFTFDSLEELSLWLANSVK